MARIESYTGSIDLISGIRPKNGGSFPLMDAHDVQTREDGTRLDEELEALRAELAALREMIQSGGAGGGTTDDVTVAGIEEMRVGTLENKTIAEVEA